MEANTTKRAFNEIVAPLIRSGTRDDDAAAGTEDGGFKVPAFRAKVTKSAPLLCVSSMLLTLPVEDELAWLSSAGTDATGASATATTAETQPQLNSEESSLIDKLLGKKKDALDLDQDDAAGKRYFGQDSSTPKNAGDSKKEPEDITDQLVYDDEADELESYLHEKKANSKTPAAATKPPTAATPSTMHSLSSPPPAAASSASHTISAAAATEPSKDLDKKQKNKSGFKF